MSKKLFLIFAFQALLGLTLGLNRIRLSPKDQYDVETSRYLNNVNNAIYTVSEKTGGTSIYELILEALEYMKNTRFWLPCVADIGSVLNATRNGFSELWALKMIDAGTKLPSGLATGNIVDLGQYDECINTQHEDIYGQHCLINFVFHLPTSSDSGVLSMVGGSLTLTMAQCFPSSCEPRILRMAFGEIGNMLTLALSSHNITVTADIPDTDCHTLNGRKQLDATEITVVAIIGVLIMIASAMTVVDYLLISKRVKDRKPNKGELVVQAFSVYNNGKKLFSLKQNPEQMNSLNGIKFMSIGWVALGHRYRYAVTVPLVNLLRVPEMIEEWSKMVIISAILSVDTFFLISGLLNAYGFCMIRDKIKGFGPFHVIHSYIHRYIRLTPAYLVMIGMTATWIWRVGDGPLWDRMVGWERDNCRTSFWSNLLYLNNYLTPDNNCMMQSWYLAADMQMFWASPFVIYPLWRWPIFGYVYITIITGLSIAAPVLVAYFYDIRTPIPISTDPAQESKEMDKLYFPTHTKTIAYVIGILVGYILYRVRVKKNMRVRLNKITNVCGWILAMLSMLYALFGGHYLYLSSKPYTLLESSLYIGFFRFFWGIGVGWVIFACTVGYGGLINSFLCLPIFGPLGRLSYCIYLTHIFIILYKFGSMRTAIYFSDYDMVQQSMGEMIFILIFASLLSLVCESPVMTLEKLILGGGGKKRSNRPPVDIKKKTDEDPTGKNGILNAAFTADEGMSPSAPTEVSATVHYPRVPDIKSLDHFTAVTNMNDQKHPPPYNNEDIYAQVIKKSNRERTLSGNSINTIPESIVTSTGPV